jgi:hypothetical protein
MKRAVLALVALAAACGQGSATHAYEDGTDAQAPGDAGAAEAAPPEADGSTTDDAGDASPPPPPDGCTDGQAYCTAFDATRTCKNSRWVDATCPSGQGCVNGACVATSCSDECRLGDAQGGKSCALWDIAAGAWATPDPATKLHDRSRAYDLWLERDGRPFGGVGSARYTDPGTYAKIEGINGLGDSAIWTGTYLAAEALRLKATGAADARARVLSIVETLHLFMSVSGDPGLLARYAAPSGAPKAYALYDLDCTQARVHCGVSRAGGTYDYIGHISRDQYQGVILGYALAYEALTDADAKAKDTIRADVVGLVKELMKERTLPLKLTYNGIGFPVANVTIRFVVTSTDELDNGAVTVDIGGGTATMTGVQEFIPDLADVVSQIAGFSPPILRSSSAVMLASFFRVALRVTDVPSAKADHDAILDYYVNHSGKGGNANDWLGIANMWSSGTDSCGSNYYANNITMEPMYDLARLEDDPARRALVRDQLLAQNMWGVFAPTKNSFFSFIYAANVTSPDPNAVTVGKAQLAQFPPPPRIVKAVDLRADPRYMPHDGSCADQTDHGGAVDVGDRPVGDFLWQRQPWGLYDTGDPKQAEPGVDYLVAYWMGRAHKFIDDDTPNACLRWK